MSQSIVTADLAATLEAAEAVHLTRQVEAYAALDPKARARVVSAGGGSGALTLAEFGRKLNHVVGFGMGAAVAGADLAKFEEAYHRRGLAVEVDLCPFADPSALTVLAKRGYSVNAFSNTYFIDLGIPDRMANRIPDRRVRPMRDDEVEETIAASVAGFAAQDNPRPARLLEALARTAAGREDVEMFVAEVEDRIVAVAATAVVPTGFGPVAHFFLASTLEDHRGEGIQLGLMEARLASARRRGIDLATTTVRPRNPSARNAERAGFELAYTRPTFVKAAPVTN